MAETIANNAPRICNNSVSDKLGCDCDICKYHINYYGENVTDWLIVNKAYITGIGECLVNGGVQNG